MDRRNLPGDLKLLRSGFDLLKEMTSALRNSSPKPVRRASYHQKRLPRHFPASRVSSMFIAERRMSDVKRSRDITARPIFAVVSPRSYAAAHRSHSAIQLAASSGVGKFFAGQALSDDVGDISPILQEQCQRLLDDFFAGGHAYLWKSATDSIFAMAALQLSS